MTSFNENIDYNKNNNVKKNNFLMFFLIFLLVVLMVTSVLIFNRFTYSSKNIKNINSNYELKFIDIYQEIPETKSISISQNNDAEESYKNIVLNTKSKKEVSLDKSKSIIIEEKKENTKKEKEIIKENKKIISNKNYQFSKIITSKNIKRYHNILLQKFSNVKIINYRVKWGDTLWKIALKYNTSAHTIYVLNTFDNPNLIISGQIIKVPVNFVLNKNVTKTIIENLLSKNNKNKTSFKDINHFNINTIVYLNKMNPFTNLIEYYYYGKSTRIYFNFC